MITAHSFPLSFGQVLGDNAGGTPGTPVWDRPQDAIAAAARAAGPSRSQEVAELLKQLFEKCRRRCDCAEDDCGLRSGSGRVAGDVAPHCQSGSCEVCPVFLAQPLTLYERSLPDRNARLNRLLRCATPIGDLYRQAKQTAAGLSAEEAKGHKQEVKSLLGQLACCGENRLNCLKNVGELAELAPHLLTVQLQSGHTPFWTELRKVAKAVNKQPGLQSKLAALMAIRMKVPVGNHWSFYLSAHDRHQQEERQILEDWGAQLATSTTTTTQNTAATP